MNEHFLQSMRIENFRGIKYAEINDLARVNLFCGKNNYGKTSILESLFLLCGISNPELMIRLQTMRGQELITGVDWKSYFYNYDHKKAIVLSGEQKQGKRELTISPMSGHLPIAYGPGIPTVPGNGSPITQARAEISAIEDAPTGLRYDFTVDDQSYQAMISQTIGQEGMGQINWNKPPGYEERLASVFSLPTKKYNPALVDKMLNAKRKSILIKALQFVNPEVRDVQMSTTGVLSADTGLDYFLPVDLLGGGPGNVTNIISSIDGAEGGLLMIDGIERGLHVSAIKPVWGMILEHSAACDTQIFATTHSKDVIKALTAVSNEKLLSDDDGNEVACFALEKLDSDEIKAYRYSVEDLIKSEEADVDIR